MQIFKKEEWAKMQYTGRWEDCPFHRDQVRDGDIPAYYIGRRNLMVAGCKLITEGVHFLIAGDYDNLPVLHKDNALEGAAYQFAGGIMFVNRIYRLTVEQARDLGAVYLDRVETTAGDFALPGSDTVKGAGA